MNGPEHYREAERLLCSAAEMERQLAGAKYDAETFPHSFATIQSARDEAQVHATLALAAATAWPAVKEWLGDEDRSGSGWTGATT